MEQENNSLTVSFCVIARNEEQTLPALFADLLAKTYSHSLMEVLLVDSASTDGTKACMEAFAREHAGEFSGIQVLDNPGRTLPCGWNVALRVFSGDVILRVDAHANIPPEFVEKNVRCLESGEAVAGGQRPCVLSDPTPWRKTLLLAENSLFGSSIAPFRRDVGKMYAKSVFHGAYRREVFETIGGYNEELGRTEDNEIHYRIRKAGYRLCFDPSIISYQHVRSSLRKMVKQKYGNGKWVGLTLGVCPGCLSLYHFVPFAFVVGILLTTVLACFGIWQLAALMWGLYALLAIAMTVACVRDENWNATSVALPFLFLLLHVSYGVGTVVGLVRLPFWKKRHHNGVSPSIGEVRAAINGKKAAGERG